MIEYRTLRKEYISRNGRALAVDDVSIRIDEGSLCVLLGPSGCGKTTLLRMTNRLVEPTSGTILINGHDVMKEEPVQLRRRIGYVIQQVGLFPHRTVAENIATTPELVGMPREKIGPRVDEMLGMMNIDPARYRDRYPAELSGGEQQRVGVARALAADPPLLLMDEPFGAIDPINRAEIQAEFRRLHRQLGKTVILVTHDIREALLLADRIAVMHQGRIEQFASPTEILTHPATGFVDRFFGEDRALLLLDTLSVGDAMEPTAAANPGPALSPDRPLRLALADLLASGGDELNVVDAEGGIMGRITLDSIRRHLAPAGRALDGERS
jgi:osmoprotectant transport system ATP-binding protein